MEKIDRIVLEFIYDKNKNGENPYYIFNEQEIGKLMEVICSVSPINQSELKISSRIERLTALGYLYHEKFSQGCIVTDNGIERLTMAKEIRNMKILSIAKWTLFVTSIGAVLALVSLFKSCV